MRSVDEWTRIVKSMPVDDDDDGGGGDYLTLAQFRERVVRNVERAAALVPPERVPADARGIHETMRARHAERSERSRSSP